MLTYKGFVGQLEHDENAKTLFGVVINANVLIHFRGTTLAELERSMHDVVDTYLEDCKQSGVEPEKPYSGTITLRVAPDVHKKAVLKAASCRQSMNEYLKNLLERDVASFETACP